MPLNGQCKDLPMRSKSFSRCCSLSCRAVARPAFQRTLVAALLAACWIHDDPVVDFCGRAARSKGLQQPLWEVTVTSSHRSFASRLPRGVPRRQAPGPNPNDDGEARRLTAQITKASSASKLLALLEKPLADANLFNHFHISAAWTMLARFKKSRQFRKADAASPVWAKLSARLFKMLQDDLLPPRGMANAFYSVGELYEEIERHMTQVLPKLCRAVEAKARGMDAQQISNCMLAAVKLQDASPEVLSAVPALAKRIPDKVQQMNQQDLSNCLWAAAALQDASPEVLDAVPALAKRIPDKVEKMVPQALSNCLWAAATLQDASPEVLNAAPALAKRIPDKVKDMKPQELSNSLWAAATLQDASPKVLHAVPALAKRIPDKVEDMVPQALSNCLWAAATLQDASPEVLSAVPGLAERIPDKVEDMVPQALSNCLLGAAKLQDTVPQVVEIVPSTVQRMKATIGMMNEQDLSNNFWAVAKLKDASPNVLSLAAELSRSIFPQVKKLATKQLRMSLRAAKQFGEDELVARLQGELDHRQR